MNPIIQSEAGLLEAIAPYENVIVYGAKKRAEVLVTRIRNSGLQPRLSVAVTEAGGTPAECAGLPVQNLAALAPLAHCAIVLVAAQPKFHAEMEKTATGCGFSTVSLIGEAAVSDMNLRHDACMTLLKMDGLARDAALARRMQCQTLNQVRLGQLREKVRRGQKARVLFLLTSAAKFNFASVYRAMREKSHLFEVALFCFEEYHNDGGFMIEADEMRHYATALEAEGFHVIWGYDEAGRSLPVEQFCPDIIFYGSPYLVNRDANQLVPRLLMNHLCCYIPYGMCVSNEPGYHFDNENIALAWLHFLDTRPAYNLCANSSIGHGMNTVLSGWPMLDEYGLPAPPFPVKLPGRPTAIYAPHWSVETWHNTATFHVHRAHMLALMRAHPGWNFVFKPHPRLGPEIRVREGRADATPLRYQDYLDYCRAWEESPNGTIVTEGGFIGLFQNAQCLITDCYTFIGAWLPAGKPCILLANPEGPKEPYKYYYDFIHPLLDTCYTCETGDEIARTFERVAVDGKDPKAEARAGQCENFIHNLGHAGEFIADYIEAKLMG